MGIIHFSLYNTQIIQVAILSQNKSNEKCRFIPNRRRTNDLRSLSLSVVLWRRWLSSPSWPRVIRQRLVRGKKKSNLEKLGRWDWSLRKENDVKHWVPSSFVCYLWWRAASSCRASRTPGLCEEIRALRVKSTIPVQEALLQRANPANSSPMVFPWTTTREANINHENRRTSYSSVSCSTWGVHNSFWCVSFFYSPLLLRRAAVILAAVYGY